MIRQFTATVHILNDDHQVLFLLHPKFNKWMPPGGHIESNETPLEAVRREAQEEAGIDIEILTEESVLVNTPVARSFPRPYLCLLEDIPAIREEPPHQHMDLIYVAKPSDPYTEPHSPEGHSIRWFTLEEVKSLPEEARFADSLEIMKHLIQESILI